MEMTEGSFRKLDPDGVNRPSMDKHEETDTGRWKRAAVCLGLLCALLLSAIALLSFKMMENKQLQTSYNNLNREKSQLQTSYNNLTKEKSQLQDKFHTMAAEKDKLQKRLCNLRMEITKYAVDVTLDPDTAHTYLILSADGKQVRLGDSSQNRPDNPKRFDYVVNVLGKQGFTSGRFYYEVEVSGKTEWDLGVARESINRKGDITASPENGLWTIWLRNRDEYMALADPSVVLSLKEKPERVGVFVDYEAGLVSFYDADRWNLIYSFRGVSFKEKIYPYLSPSLHENGKNSSPLIIVTPFPCTK
ncbi:nuclear factor 7, ovary-like isoform X6 [Clupea harengus]|uniref:Nuclear factor 7, ovary-like isoform X5 n=1 Tax=Clupea harengus TaxID=7950 RepID=A0A8M1KUR3_CLUHA|nr:nuclear factor 7, ovary-like isoform X5 [Clupea harengus]XP_042565345.1 nuclear factor 7, ovary-like isoform X6 [Clupea harengus]